MKKIVHLLFLAMLSVNALAQYQGPVAAPTSGFGANGTSSISVTMLVNDHWALNKIAVYYPTGTTTPVPTIFYSHGFGANDTTNNRETLRHIASKGYAVVYVPYKTIGATVAERYATLHDGFNKAARALTTIIDTTRAGFAGHSFGGGATPRMAYNAYVNQHWGANGKFIYCSAPWYSFELGDTALVDFPADCNMLTLLYNDDETNDHRMGMDIFNHIAISNVRKDCIMVYSDTVSGYIYQADHTLPAQYTSNGEFDVFDYYVTARFLDALTAYTFTGDATAGNVALGNGSAQQVNMGSQLTPLVVTDSPAPAYPQSKYQFRCDSSVNERGEYCQDPSLGLAAERMYTTLRIYPNPSTGKLSFGTGQLAEDAIISVYNSAGILVFQSGAQPTIDLSDQPEGMYIVSVVSVEGIVRSKVALY